MELLKEDIRSWKDNRVTIEFFREVRKLRAEELERVLYASEKVVGRKIGEILGIDMVLEFFNSFHLGESIVLDE